MEYNAYFVVPQLGGILVVQFKFVINCDKAVEKISNVGLLFVTASAYDHVWSLVWASGISGEGAFGEVLSLWLILYELNEGILLTIVYLKYVLEYFEKKIFKYNYRYLKK